MLQPDSTPSPVAESTAQFAVGDQHRLVAGLVCSDSVLISGQERRGSACVASAAALGLGGSEDAVSPPSNTGVKSAGRGVGVLSAASDWLTLTATTDEGAQQLWEVQRDLTGGLVNAGDQVRPQRREMQYSGHGVGRHLFYGQNAKQGSYLRVSSHVAADVLERVRAFREWYFNCTRHDLQVTLQLPEPPGAEYFRDLTRGSRDAAANLRGRKTRPWHVTLRDEDGRGDTVYVGLPKSDVRGTVYDKHKESLESGTLWPEGSVRFEVRSRRDVAMGILKQLKDCEYVPGYTAGYVSAWFEARGVLLPVDVAAIQEVRAAPRTTDVARQCKWLRDGVAPTVRRLLLSGVPRDELMVYLGLRGA